MVSEINLFVFIQIISLNVELRIRNTGHTATHQCCARATLGIVTLITVSKKSFIHFLSDTPKSISGANKHHILHKNIWNCFDTFCSAF